MARTKRFKDVRVAATTAETTYQLKVTVLGIEPPIWRRLQVPGRIGLDRLHQVLQIAFGWADDHLHQFTVNGRTYGEAQIEAPLPIFAPPPKDERRTRLSQVAPAPGAEILYEYDFGDGWEHRIEVEQILPNDPAQPPFLCLAGERAGPPEDCGGVPGYYEAQEILADPDHPQYTDLREWYGEDYDPEAFDLAAINQQLDSFLRGSVPDWRA